MKLPVLIISILPVACIHTTPVPALGDWIASDSSQYSPVAHFRAHTTLAADGIHIAIDSGSLYVPGVLVPDSPALMSGLSLTAILAVPDSGSLAIGPTGSGPRRRGAARLASTRLKRLSTAGRRPALWRASSTPANPTRDSVGKDARRRSLDHLSHLGNRRRTHGTPRARRCRPSP